MTGPAIDRAETGVTLQHAASQPHGMRGAWRDLPAFSVKLHYMSAQNRTMSDTATGILGFVGMSALAGILVTAAVTPALAVTGMAANNGISMFENLPGYLNIEDLSEKTDIYAVQADV